MCTCTADFVCPEALKLWEEANRLWLPGDYAAYHTKMNEYKQHRKENAYKDYEVQAKR